MTKQQFARAINTIGMVNFYVKIAVFALFPVFPAISPHFCFPRRQEGYLLAHRREN